MTVRRNKNDDIEIILPGDMDIDGIRDFLERSVKSHEVISKLTEEEKKERIEKAFDEFMRRKRAERENVSITGE